MPAHDAKLPVEAVLDDLDRQLDRAGTVILQAPPGSGKTTRVPPALLDASWLTGQRILMLEPRRIAASNAARYMAGRRGEPVGDTIGYSVRYERRSGPRTRLEVLTEGLLTRRLQSDPELAGVGLVIFDEFHERSLQADLALALCRDIQQGLRPDLRLLVMSATLDAAPLAGLLGDCPIVTSSGRAYPVAIEHLADAEIQRIAEATAHGIRRALRQGDDDILAFLPGAGEIHRCHDQLSDIADHVDLRPLYGGLPFVDQEAAILPGERRRVVLATNVAETSLTIEGIGAVVDSGWERRPRFDAERGMTRLELQRISQASADQRAGRAGRLGPGRCYRLWSEGTHGALLPYAPAEIRQADLAPLALEIAQWGVRDVLELTWFDQPPAGQLEAARKLLQMLGALDASGTPTALGRRMAGYPVHPRLARMLVAAIDAGRPGLGSDLVALLDERDLFAVHGRVNRSKGQSDLLERLECLHGDRSQRTVMVRRTATFWRNLTGAGREPAPEAEMIGRLLACAYPDRIGRRRAKDSRRYLLRNGQGVTLAQESVLHDAEWLVAVETGGRPGIEDEIRLASELSASMIEELCGRDLHWQREAGWDEQVSRILVRDVKRLGAIVLQERPTRATAEDTVPALLGLVRRRGLDALPWTMESKQLRARAALLQKQMIQDWQDWTEQALLADLEGWLSGWMLSARSLDDLKAADLSMAIKARLGRQRLIALDRLAPEKIQVPSGSMIRLDYSMEQPPVLAVKLQEMFGQTDTPRLCDDRVPVLVHLLSPAGRPLAVTGDLRNFWDSVYPEVRREMKGRYPKHPWPEDPWRAEATGRTRRRKNPES